MRNWLFGIFGSLLPVVGCVIVGILIYQLVPIVQGIRAMHTEIRESEDFSRRIRNDLDKLKNVDQNAAEKVWNNAMEQSK